MIQRILITMSLFMLFSAPVFCGQPNPEEVQQNMAHAKSVKTDIQANTDDSNWDRQGMIQEIRNAKSRLTWLKYRQEKTRRYIAHAKESIEDLEHKKEEFNKLQDQLRPYLKMVVSRLEDFISQDLPFLPDDRSKRVTWLYNSLDDPDESLSELLQMVFEGGLEIETEFGKGVDASEITTLNIDGIDTEVVIFQLGRIGMYYMSLDEKKTGFYNTATDNWESLPESMNKKIKLAVRISQRERAVEILNLPLGVAK